MFGLGLPELIVIFLAILLLFGTKSLPEIARGLGQAIRIFKKEMNDMGDTPPSPLKGDGGVSPEEKSYE